MEVKPITMSKESMARDKIVSKGLKIRQRSHALFFASLLGCFVLTFGHIALVGIPLLIFMASGYAYSRTFYLWERDNKEYLKSLGFTIKGE